MSSELHRRVKELFGEICELPPDQQKKRIDKLAESMPEIAAELKSLLSYHTSQSLVVDTPTPKIRTRSTLSKTFQSRPSVWLRIVLRALLYAVPLALFGMLISYWTNDRIHSLLYSSVTSQLEDLMDHRVQQFRQWEASQISKAVEWSLDQEVSQHVRDLVHLAEDVNKDGSITKMTDLVNAEAAEKLRARLKKVSGMDVKFAVWDRRMMTISDWSQREQPELLGSFATPSGAAMLTEVFKGTPRLYLPGQSAVISEGFEMEPGATNMFALVPIASENGDVDAVMMLRGYGLEASFEQLFDRWSKLQSSETYLVSQRGALLTASRYGDALDQLTLADPKEPIYVRDPGVNLLAGAKSDYTPLAWPLTFSARQVTSGNSGMSIDGYRNYVGMEVVGAWRWMEDVVSVLIFPSSSTGSPMTFITRPSVAFPTGTEIGPPRSRTFIPRTMPSVGNIETARTRPSPRCCWTSATTSTGVSTSKPSLTIRSA